MAEINGGSLSFKSEMDNNQLNAAIDETLRRVQGFSDAVVGSGDVMDNTTQEMIAQVRSALAKIGDACDEHEQALDRLGQEYDRLGQEMGRAFASGRDDEFRALQERRNAIQGEITVRKQLLNELHEQSNVLESEAAKLEESARQAEEAANKHVSLRSRIKELREEMALYREAYGDQTEDYKKMAAELGRLQDIQGDIQAQGKIFANDEAQFQGIITGLSGVAGGFTAAQGAMALFTGENENLQKVMLKVQSLMSITMGLQQTAQALNKDSAFRLVTLNRLKEWWNKLLAVGRGEQIAATAATVAGTTANIGLAGAFRMVGAAIKSIPVFGWVLTGISALIALVTHFVSKAREAKKAQEEWYKSIAENSYKPIAKIEELSLKWNALSDDFEAKRKFIEQNKKAFDELGVSINGVTDAENILNKNKGAFIQAQIDKAKAMLLVQQAQDKVKTLMEKEQEYNAMPDKVRESVMVGISPGNEAPVYEQVWVVNKAKEEVGKSIKALRDEITQGFEDASIAESAGFNALKQAGIEATETYADGTLGAIEQAIQREQAALKSITNNADYEDALKRISDLQKQAEAITGKGTTGSNVGDKKDLFLEKLNARKAEYQRFAKWLNSGDAILVQSANKEFEGLLKEGSTYIDYLKNQRDQILSIDVANRTKAQNKQLRQLNDAIAEETKQTVLEAFNTELNEQLTNAKTTLEMLKIIEQKRKELANDGTELDTAKGKTLDDAEKNAKEQLVEETQELLENYASYAKQKGLIDEAYNRDYEALMARRKQTTDEAAKAEIDAAIANRKKKRDDDVNNIGGVDYNALLSEYGTFEQRKQAIIDEYEEKRKAAQAVGNAEMVEALNKAQAEALSKFALDELQAHPDWELMFGDLDEISTRKLQELIDKINGLDGVYLGIEFDPKDLEVLKDKVEAMKSEIKERNPFKSLVSSIKDYGKAANDESKKKALTNMFESASGAIDLIGGTLDAVTNGLEKMGVTMDDETKAIMGDIGGILDGASQIASGIATGNPLSIIQGSIGLLTSAFDLFNTKDRQAERQIKKHQEAIAKLEKEYTQLSWAIDKALGGDVYKNQQSAIRNMKEQQEHLRESWNAEISKKKTDWDKVDDFKEQYAELERQITDMYDEISNDLLQVTAKDFATQLSDSLTTAFKSGEDSAKAFEDTVNAVLQNVVVNQLKKKFLEQQLQGALDQLEGAMGYWNGDDFVFTGLTDAEIASFKARVQTAANNYEQALSVYSDLFKDMNIEESDDSLTGAVKGVSEETASIVAGQMNAIRINQLEATNILRQQLQTLNAIATNTSYNRYLARIERIITILETYSGDSLRSKGLS